MSRKLFPKMPSYKPDVYRGTIYLTTSRSTYQKAADYLGSDFMPEGVGVALSAWDDRMGRVYVMGVFDRDILTLQHECNHVALDTIESSAFSAHDGRGEPFCYLSEAIFAAFYRRFMRPKAKRLQKVEGKGKGVGDDGQLGPEVEEQEGDPEVVVHGELQKAIKKPRLASA